MCSKCWREEVNRREQLDQTETEAKVTSTEEETAAESKAAAKGSSGELHVRSEPLAEEPVVAAETAPVVPMAVAAAVPAGAAPQVPQESVGRPESKRSAGEEAPASATKTKKKKKKPRCGVCDKKLGVTAIMCRCELHFCSVHRYPECHDCTFDFRQAERAVLAEQVTGGGQFERVTKI